jgi:hypothetical protein
MATTMDLFVTCANIGGAEVPKDRPIDGTDIAPLLFGKGKVERDAFMFYRGATLYATRLGPWKAHFITRTGYGPEKPLPHDPPALHHLGRDPGERFNVSAQNSEVLARITAAVEKHRAGVQAAPSQLFELAN